MTRKRALNSGFPSALLLGLAVLAGSCTTTPTGSSSSNGGTRTESSALGGQSGHGSGGAVGAGGTVASGGATGSGGTAGSAGGMAGGGQAGSAGPGGSGMGGSASGGSGAADAATNRDSASDPPPNPDVPAKLDAPTEFWTTSFVPNCTPPAIGGRAQTDGHHRAGEDCMQSGCHLAGSPDAGVPFLFSGTVRRAGSLATYPSVEVAVKTPSEFYAACSASNGNFWIVSANASGSLDWNTATARVRTSNGETAMLPAPEAACNSCHSEILLLTAP
jgi:hypothetical protein